MKASDTSLTLRNADGPNDIAAARTLFHEYAEALEYDTCFDDFGTEVEGLPGEYGPPRGALLIAQMGEHTVGVVGLRSVDRDTAELKRLYVRPQARGHGVGRDLVLRVLAQARDLRYRTVILETLPRMIEAQGLYERLGFRTLQDQESGQIRRMELNIDPN